MTNPTSRLPHYVNPAPYDPNTAEAMTMNRSDFVLAMPMRTSHEVMLGWIREITTRQYRTTPKV